MHNQPKYKPLRPSALFADGSSARPLLEGTVARGLMAAYCDSQREVFSLSEKEAWSRPPQRDLDDAPELHGDSTGRVLGATARRSSSQCRRTWSSRPTE
jgi:hypothetical protein